MNALRLLVGLLPPSRTKNRLLSTLSRHWHVVPGATVSPCLLWRVTHLSIGDGAFVGLGTVFRDLHRVSIGDGAEVGQLNWVSGAGRYVRQADDGRAASLDLAARAAITSRHYLDCSGGLSIGELTILAGVRTTVLTHSVDVHASVQRATPVTIGEACFIGTCSVITDGVTLGDRCVVGAGSVVVDDLPGGESLYAGAPARRLRSLSGARFFVRPELRMVPRDVAAEQLAEARRSAAGR